MWVGGGGWVGVVEPMVAIGGVAMWECDVGRCVVALCSFMHAFTHSKKAGAPTVMSAVALCSFIHSLKKGGRPHRHERSGASLVDSFVHGGGRAPLPPWRFVR